MNGEAALSVSPFVGELLRGSRRRGIALGHGFVRFEDDVVAVTQPDAPRMPNGIETRALPPTGAEMWIGEGVLESDGWRIGAGPLWPARPRVRYLPSVKPRPQLRLDLLPGLGPGLTPLGDDILVGYLAGLALTGGDARAIERAAREFALTTSALSRTLLRLAARGELPEPAHALLEQGDAQPLWDFGATSGQGIALGLGLACSIDIATPAERPGAQLDLVFPPGNVRPRRIRTRLSTRTVVQSPQPSSRRERSSRERTRDHD